VTATDDLTLDSEATRYTHQHQRQGLSLELGLSPSVGFETAYSESRALAYIQSHFNVAGLTTLVAGGALSLKGIYLKTREAVLSAATAELKTCKIPYRLKTTAWGLQRPSPPHSPQGPITARSPHTPPAFTQKPPYSSPFETACISGVQPSP